MEGSNHIKKLKGAKLILWPIVFKRNMHLYDAFALKLYIIRLFLVAVN